jgi:hypothetical protein
MLGDLFELCALIPWWVGGILAAITYVLLNAYASTPTQMPTPGQPVLSHHTFLKLLASVLQYVLPLVMLAGAVASAISRRKRFTSGGMGSPTCPSCRGAMIRRMAKRGEKAGEEFWGCSNFPRCKGTRDI